MTINNTNNSVNSTAKNLFYSIIPFGSEYYIYSTGTNSYSMLLRRIGKKDFETYSVTRSSSSSDYVLTKGSNATYEDITVSKPYYAYSSEAMQGIAETLPCMGYVNSAMLLVLASCAVLCVVFGGVRMWRRK